MSANLYRVNPSLAKSPLLSSQVLNALENLNQTYATLLTIRAAMIQEKDGSAGDATDWVTVANQFGFVDSNGAISSAVALAAFSEIDSFVGNGGPSLTQCCARFKQ